MVENKDMKEKMENTENTKNKEQTNQEKVKDTENKKNDTKKKKNTSSSKKKKSSVSAELKKKDEEIEELRYKMSEINDKYLRLSAEFDNYRKRTLKEKTDLMKTAGGDVLSDLLPVMDDFERALQSMEKAEDVQAVKDGVTLIYNKFKDFIKSKGVVEIDALNQDFDTDIHEALTKIPAPDEKLKGKVVDVIQKGYKIEDKVIRYAKVVVGE